MTRLVKIETHFPKLRGEMHHPHSVGIGRTSIWLESPHRTKVSGHFSFGKMHPVIKSERLNRMYGRDYLSRVEVADIAISEIERTRGQSKRFKNIDDALRWLHED